MSELSRCHDFGVGIQVTGDLALKSDSESTNRGCRQGLWRMGYLALAGIVMRSNWRKAVRLFKAAFEAGEHRGGKECALCYLHGIEVEQDANVVF